MFLSGTQVNQYGHLTIGGVDTVALCAQYGTPLYVMDEEELRRRCRSFARHMREMFPDGRVAYACKAFCCKEMCRIASGEGIHLDIVSRGELHTALSAGLLPERMILHGYNKSARELREALDHGVGRIVVDSFDELVLLNELAGAASKTADILLRITPGVCPDTHRAVITGADDSKFGFSLKTGDAQRAVETALSHPSLRLCGVHCHIGSQIADCAPFVLAAERMADFLTEINRRTGRALPELNLGGGFAIRYCEDDEVPAPEDYLRSVSEGLHRRCRQNGVQCPRVTIEPGRSIAGPCGITLYTAGSIKQIPDIRTFVAIDGGMTDNPRYALYHARYTAVVANRMDAPCDCTVTLAGRCCESGDLLGERMPLQNVQTGDIVAVLATGAYNFSMASSYNRLPHPAVVMVSGGVSRVVVRRQSIEDILACDL
ncbi:MAG: diaminopimelate decarboxylase [Acetanaerobacterium sp.]